MELVPDSGREALLVMLAAFIVTFAVTRLVVRAIRSGRGPFGDVQMDGLHIHHLVPGIFLLLIAGVLEFAVVPHAVWRDVLAGAFGVGAALTLDEFALWLHLNDVYWTDEGRKSVDAVIVAAGLGLVMLVAANPFVPEQGESRSFFAGFLALSIGLALVAVLKGRFFLGLAGVMIPLFAIVAALRLARPGSPWFRRFYQPGTAKYVKATRRARGRGRWGGERLKSTVSGFPNTKEKR